MKYVIDAAVFVKWFVVEIQSNIANRIRDDFLEGKFELFAPEFLPYEVVNALIYSKLFNNEELTEVNEALSEYEITFNNWTKNVADLATDIAIRYDKTIYDAYYLALAVQLDCKFITADSKFYKKFINTQYIENLLLLRNY
ncbi:MAG: type II toxin-antitoxin system VapC family toxin [Candidatus Heimdallarchaeota archaeon]